MEIDKRYKTPSIGIYNRNVFECTECGTSILNDYYKHICGIAEAPVGTVSVKECPTCFTKYNSHLSTTDYSLFLHSIKKGENLHFKPNKL
ncbi:hypothetical protein IMSAGC001_00160 [Bacteroides acidifaciens]|uniref:Uncharacterized protein n=2 Tax=Bacteroides acidifaciens TaxID=85831 RepID=A0A7I9ZXA8_9BACE|nr:hypothetical protein IMSAGC001_00160 [Bacteroides acidifaciens]